jgi:hypothetical protein
MQYRWSFLDIDLTKSSVYNITYLRHIKQNRYNFTIHGNKGYLSINYQLDLFEQSNITLEVPLCNNQLGYVNQNFIFVKPESGLKRYFQSYVISL